MKHIAFLDVLTVYGLGVMGLAVAGLWYIYARYANGLPKDHVAIVNLGDWPIALIFVFIPILLFGMTKLANFALARRQTK